MNIMYSLIVQDPQGAVTNAICALASLHYNQVCVAQGISGANANSIEDTTSKLFYDEAVFLLAERKQMHGQYSESDAIAALQLVHYSLLSGGAADWQAVLTVACEWLSRTDLVTDENPALSLLNMSLAAQFAVTMTMVKVFPFRMVIEN
jgi:hypothetical protein